MNTVFFECISGASGDMILASLIDCGVPVEYLQTEIDRLGIEGLTIRFERVNRSGIMCAHMKLSWATQREFRHVQDIRELIARGAYPARVVARCERVLMAIANAEAQVHGVAIDDVHFHEIGAVDTIVDILGVSLCLEYLKVDEIRFSALVTGYGTIKTQHGIMPVPAPATAILIEGMRLRHVDIQSELLTPTGAAILVTLGQQAPVAAGRMIKAGSGCGDKQFAEYPNYLRAVLFDLMATEGTVPAGVENNQVCVIETDMDHISGEVMGYVAQKLLSLGALDASFTPIYMKKGRPGFRLTVMANLVDRGELVDVILIETRSLGVRYTTMERTIWNRTEAVTRFGGENLAGKECAYKGHSFSKIEYEALAALAEKKNRPLIELLDEYNKDDS